MGGEGTAHLLTPAVGEVQAQRLALAHQVDMQVGEPHGEGEQHQQQQQLELLPDLLHREPQHPPGSMPGGSLCPRGVSWGARAVLSAGG